MYRSEIVSPNNGDVTVTVFEKQPFFFLASWNGENLKTIIYNKIEKKHEKLLFI